MNIIETERLTKTYRRFKKPEGLSGSIRSLWKREYEEKAAVRDFDFALQEGELIGLIGPNGREDHPDEDAHRHHRAHLRADPCHGLLSQ